MGYGSILINSKDVHGTLQIEEEKKAVVQFLRLLARVGVDRETIATAVYRYDSKMVKRTLESFERAKNEILET